MQFVFKELDHEEDIKTENCPPCISQGGQFSAWYMSQVEKTYNIIVYNILYLPGCT